MKTINAEVKPQTKEEKRQALRTQLDELTRDALDFDASYYLTEEDLDDGDLDTIMDKLQDAVNENAEILYYSRAIEFLSENDASLNRSLELVKEYGYSLEDLNSEKLAKQALELCQGRGGDQAAYRDNGEFRFFGGVFYFGNAVS